MKTRRAPFRHCRDARVYGHTTTATHDMEYVNTHPLARGATIVCLVLGEDPACFTSISYKGCKGLVSR